MSTIQETVISAEQRISDLQAKLAQAEADEFKHGRLHYDARARVECIREDLMEAHARLRKNQEELNTLFFQQEGVE